MNDSQKTLNDELKELKGQRLSSVEFVADYVQLHFDDFTLTAYTQIDVIHGEEKISLGNPKYRDLLCSQIQFQVKDASFVKDREIIIIFDDNIILKVSLAEESYRGPEAMQLTSRDGSIWVA
jgi:hypothetical protein